MSGAGKYQKWLMVRDRFLKSSPMGGREKRALRVLAVKEISSLVCFERLSLLSGCFADSETYFGTNV